MFFWLPSLAFVKNIELLIPWWLENRVKAPTLKDHKWDTQ